MATLKEIRQRLGWAEDQLVNFIEKAGGTPDADPPTDSALHHVRVARSGLSEHIGSGENAADGDAAVEPVFEDGFETGDKSHSENGYRWGIWVNGAVVADAARTGSYGLRLTYPGKPDGEDSSPLMDLRLGDDLTEIWVSYWMRVPSNYKHRDQASTTNNKFFQLWGGKRSDEDVAVIAETHRKNPVGDGDREESGLHWINSSKESTDLSWQGIKTPFIARSDHGTWMRIRWHLRVTSWPDGGDGLVEVWKNGTKIYSRGQITDLICDDEACNSLDMMRLLGWSNSGFDDKTVFAFDDITIYAQDPGW